MCWGIIGTTAQNTQLVRCCRANVGPTIVLQLFKLKCWTNTGPISARQQWHFANDSNDYPTLQTSKEMTWCCSTNEIQTILTAQFFMLTQSCKANTWKVSLSNYTPVNEARGVYRNPFVCPSVCVRLSVCLSVSLSIHLSVCSSVCADSCPAHNIFFGLTLAYHIWHMGVSP